MDPSQPIDNQIENALMFNGPFTKPDGGPIVVPPTVSSPDPTLGGPGNPDPQSGRSRTVIYVAVVVELLIIIVLAIVLISNSKSTPSTKTNSNANTSGLLGPQPATALGVQQASDSITQDVGNLNDDHDLPPNKLDDQPLGL